MKQISDVFQLNDEQYWQDPWLNRKKIQRSLMQKSQEALLLGAPSIIGLDEHSSIPIAMLRVAKMTTLQKIPFKGNVIITAVNLQTGKVYSSLVAEKIKITSTKSTTTRPSKPDSFANDTNAMMSEGYTLDLAKHFNLPMMRGEYLVSLSLHDLVSNHCLIKITETSNYNDTAVETFFIKQLTQHLKIPSIYPPLEFDKKTLNYLQSKQSPVLPTEQAIKIKVPRVTAINQDTQCMLHASYRLPIKPHQCNRDDKNLDLKGFSAVVSVTLLITGVTTVTPKLISLGIPCSTPLQAQNGELIASGYFSFDLCKLIELAKIPQTYFIYLYSGLVQSEATPLAFVKLPQVN